MFDKIGRTVDDPRHQDLVVRNFAFSLLEDRPLVGVTGIRGFEKKIPAACFHQHWKHFIHIDITDMRPLVIAPADVHANAILRHLGQRVVERLDMASRDLEEFGVGEIAKQHVARQGQVGAVELQIEPGGDDGFVFRLHRIGEGGEVQLRGPHVMAGYHNLPDKTAETLTEDGWLRTGDKGEIDADGFLTITGRIKELFKTSGGKYIAPSAIEAKFKALCPYVSQFMVFGAERNFVVALVTLDPDAMAGWAEENGMAGKDYTEVVRSEQVQQMIGGYVEQLNAKLNRWETIKKWDVLDHDLTIESGELTPSMKVKRNVVESNNKEKIASFYS